MRKLSAIVFAVAALAVFAVAAMTLSSRGSGVTEPPQKKEDVEANAAPAAARRAVVVELFTSEGCSSCPPADALLALLDKTQPVEGAEVIPLAMHVDYWNQLGWADPFSSHQFSERQGEYAAAFGKEDVYTPQMVVDGVKEFNGGNSSLAQETIGKAAREPKGEVMLARSPSQSDSSVHISAQIDKFPKPTEGETVSVLLALTESGLASDVARGENSGRRLTHVGVVRSLKSLGGLPEAPGTSFKAETEILIEKGWRRENLRAVVFAQERGTRRVLAAGSLKLFD
ncbi:MAG: hypothetical protein QOH49_1169 [Acidobacteriota bacterium]|jgi:hypothetical protein|nr:hypothetical protein [Acidobacteriota bacterium]